MTMLNSLYDSAGVTPRPSPFKVDAFPRACTHKHTYTRADMQKHTHNQTEQCRQLHRASDTADLGDLETGLLFTYPSPLPTHTHTQIQIHTQNLPNMALLDFTHIHTHAPHTHKHTTYHTYAHQQTDPRSLW